MESCASVRSCSLSSLSHLTSRGARPDGTLLRPGTGPGELGTQTQPPPPPPRLCAPRQAPLPPPASGPCRPPPQSLFGLENPLHPVPAEQGHLALWNFHSGRHLVMVMGWRGTP